VNAKKPLQVDKPPADDPMRKRSKVSGGGGEADVHHRHASRGKAGH
jgi:hypothetical protein